MQGWPIARTHELLLSFRIESQEGFSEGPCHRAKLCPCLKGQMNKEPRRETISNGRFSGSVYVGSQRDALIRAEVRMPSASKLLRL